MILSIYLLASIIFLGAPFGMVSALVATGMMDFLVFGFVLRRSENLRKAGMDFTRKIQRVLK